MVAVKPLIVHWHEDNAPIYSASFGSGRLATAGGDNNVCIWSLSVEPVKVEHIATLSQHAGAVNAVAFNSTGSLLASGGDDGAVFLWTRTAALNSEEKWSIVRKCRTASFGEIYDLAWSPCGKYLAAASMDKTVSILNVADGLCVKAMQDHRQYVQGVAWDPRGEFLATQGSDQRVLVYPVNLENNKFDLATPLRVEKHEHVIQDQQPVQLQFYPESFNAFFRRLSFSQDGELLVLPALILATKDEGVKKDAAAIYARPDFKTPVAVLPLNKPAIVVVFSPRIYKGASSALVKLPYTLVFAIATTNAVFIYSTASSNPLGMATNLHYASLTDLAWSENGEYLLTTSVDGFASIIQFDSGLGEIDNEAELSLKNSLPKQTYPELDSKAKSDGVIATESLHTAAPEINMLVPRRKSSRPAA